MYDTQRSLKQQFKNLINLLVLLIDFSIQLVIGIQYPKLLQQLLYILYIYMSLGTSIFYSGIKNISTVVFYKIHIKINIHNNCM